MFKTIVSHFDKQIYKVLLEKENSHAVFVVIDDQNNKTVMKIVTKDSYTGRNEHFVSLMLKKYKHPNIISILDVYKYITKTDTYKESKVVVENGEVRYDYSNFDEDGYYIIHMQYYENDLHSFLNKKPLDGEDDLNEIKKWCLQILKALQYFHDIGLVHMDIKSRNVVINEQNDLLLIDFGLTTKNEPTKNTVGTKRYMSPELVKNKNKNNIHREFVNDLFKCDVYSAGLLFLDMEVLNHIDANIEYVFEQKNNDDWNNLLSHMLETNPEKRFTVEQCLKHKFFN
jgi:non-specific serine/threonine protein kinase